MSAQLRMSTRYVGKTSPFDHNGSIHPSSEISYPRSSKGFVCSKMGREACFQHVKQWLIMCMWVSNESRWSGRQDKTTLDLVALDSHCVDWYLSNIPIHRTDNFLQIICDIYRCYPLFTQFTVNTQFYCIHPVYWNLGCFINFFKGVFSQ